MLAAAIYVHCSVSPALEKAAAAHPGMPLYVTGHSLGGAVAALLTLLLMHPNVRALLMLSLTHSHTPAPSSLFCEEPAGPGADTELCTHARCITKHSPRPLR
jgi:surfactin synthase thioesterase subunit